MSFIALRNFRVFKDLPLLLSALQSTSISDLDPSAILKDDDLVRAAVATGVSHKIAFDNIGAFLKGHIFKKYAPSGLDFAKGSFIVAGLVDQTPEEAFAPLLGNVVINRFERGTLESMEVQSIVLERYPVAIPADEAKLRALWQRDHRKADLTKRLRGQGYSEVTAAYYARIFLNDTLLTHLGLERFSRLTEVRKTAMALHASRVLAPVPKRPGQEPDSATASQGLRNRASREFRLECRV